MKTGWFDCHCHTEQSHDSQCDVAELCHAAVEKGLRGVAVTDHCDIQYSKSIDVLSPILASVRSAERMRDEYGDRLKVFAGVEMGEAIWFPDMAKKVLDSAKFDVILGSVHAVRSPYSEVNFVQMTPVQLHCFMQRYFEDVAEMIETQDFDVLSHLSCPVRYIQGKFRIPMDLTRYTAQIDGILRSIIDKGIALEVNTSSLGNENYDMTLPDEMLLKRYLDFGGRKITLGSDAHVADRVGFGFDRACEMLLGVGVKELTYFEKRQAKTYRLED